MQSHEPRAAANPNRRAATADASPLQQALEASRRENTILRQKLDALARRFFGKKSEQLMPRNWNCS